MRSSLGPFQKLAEFAGIAQAMVFGASRRQTTHFDLEPFVSSGLLGRSRDTSASDCPSICRAFIVSHTVVQFENSETHGYLSADQSLHVAGSWSLDEMPDLASKEEALRDLKMRLRNASPDVVLVHGIRNADRFITSLKRMLQDEFPDLLFIADDAVNWRNVMQSERTSTGALGALR
ncbi:MAG: hypothetical protein AAFV69_04885 [Pseudomonadota bacterium]